MKKILFLSLISVLISFSIFAQDVENTDENSAEGAKSKSKKVSFIVETHPLAWAIFGANVDLELNVGNPFSFVFEYKNYGDYAPAIGAMISDDELSANHFSFGVTYYPMYNSRKDTGVYLGASYNYIECEYVYIFEKSIEQHTEMVANGVEGEIGWRWTSKNNITCSFSIFAGYYAADYKQKGFDKADEDYDEDIDDGKFSAQYLTGMIDNVKAGLLFTVGLQF